MISEPIQPVEQIDPEISGQGKLVIREGQLRVAQVSAAELKSGTDVSSDINISNISAASDVVPEKHDAVYPPDVVPENPDTVALMGGLEECTSWMISYVASANQYCRNENDVYNKIKRDFSVFHDKEHVLGELRAVAGEIPLMEFEDEGTDKMYRTSNSIRYLVDSCVTLHFFMKGSGCVERTIKEHHKDWYEEESWEALGLPHECFQKILKGKVYKAMNGAIAGKYSSWAGVKEFAQKHTHGAANHQIKLSELYRIMKKDFAAPHDIIRHMKMDQALEYCILNVPGLQIVDVKDDKKVATDSDVLDLVQKVKHLQVSGVKNIGKEFTSFHPDCRDWTSYHMTYQKLNQHFKNILNPNFNRRRSKSVPQEEGKTEICSAVLDSSNKTKHTYRAIGINIPLEKKRPRSEDSERHVNHNEQGRSRSNSVAEREENTTVYLNSDKRSVVTIVGLPGTGKTTTLATMLGKVHTKTCPSTVLVISSSCSTTNRLLQFTSGTVLRAAPSVEGAAEKCQENNLCCNTYAEGSEVGETSGEEEEGSSKTFIIHDGFEKVDIEKPESLIEELVKPHSPIEELEKPEYPSEDKAYSPTQSLETPADLDGISLEDGEIREIEAKTEVKKISIDEKPIPDKKEDTDIKIEDEFKKDEIPWKVYDDIEEVLNRKSEGIVTILHFPNYDDMDPEVICGALEHFKSIPSKHPKYLIIDNLDVLTHPCNSNTLDHLIGEHRHNNMSIWVAGTSPSQLPVNLMDYSHLAVLHQFTSKNWYTELADHLPVTSVTFQHCQGLSPGQCIMVAPGANMQHPVHSSSFCYPCTIVPPKPLK